MDAKAVGQRIRAASGVACELSDAIDALPREEKQRVLKVVSALFFSFRRQGNPDSDV